MSKGLLCGLTTVMFALSAAPLNAQQMESERRANITGERGVGRCIVEVEIDGIAELSLRDQTARLRTISGREAEWRNFQCSQPLPRDLNAAGLRVGHRGRGQVDISDRDRDGAILIRINDSKGGSDRYVFTLDWRAGGSGSGDYRPADNPYRDRDRDWRNDNRDRATRACADAVIDRLRRDGYGDVRIGNASIDDRPGPRDRILGRVNARQNWGSEEFVFSCGVDFRNASIRSVDVVPR